jgi:hypothetical protein
LRSETPCRGTHLRLSGADRAGGRGRCREAFLGTARDQPRDRARPHGRRSGHVPPRRAADTRGTRRPRRGPHGDDSGRIGRALGGGHAGGSRPVSRPCARPQR